MKSVRILLFAVMLTVLSVGSALAQTIQITNNMGGTIHQLGLVDSGATEVTDLLGDAVFENGQTVEITISGGTTGWKLMAADEDGETLAWEDLDLTGISSIVLNADGTIDGN